MKMQPRNILLTLIISGFLAACSDSGDTAAIEAHPVIDVPAVAQAESAARLSGIKSESKTESKTFTNSIGTEFILIPAGSFMMGADENDEEADDNEMPQHRVTLSQPFYLGKYPVTQAEWVAVMGNNPSENKGRNNPVESVSWNEVQTFISRLNKKEGTNKYRLPTEAEWEYAARAGTKSAYFFGDDVGQLEQYAWYEDNSGNQTHPVGQKKPNPWGLYDMHGNVVEWVNDWYDDSYYSRSPSSDPAGPSRGTNRAERGGSWSHSAWWLRSATRNLDTPDSRDERDGFRLARSVGQ